MPFLLLLRSGLGASEPVTGECQRVAFVAVRGRLVGRFCRKVVEIFGRGSVDIALLPVVLTLTAWLGVGVLLVMSALVDLG